MYVTVSVGGNLKLRIPCADGSKRIGWLQSEIIRRYGLRTEGAKLRILELKTTSNCVLDPNDQIVEVLKNEELVLAVLKTNSDSVRVGDMFAHRYYVISIIGDGTYGHVFRARDLTLDRDVALKCLKKSRANRLNTKRFLREAKVTASLGFHPNIVTLYDSGQAEDGTLYLVMELLHGEPMSTCIERHMTERKAIPEITLVALFAQLLKGLQAAHSLTPPIIHRDLKPDNIYLVDHRLIADTKHDLPTPVLLDFGIAISSDSSNETAPCGTRMYSSPEQTRRGTQVDASSDIWSAGAILYQCVTLFIDLPFDPFELRADSMPFGLNNHLDIRD